MSQQRKVEVFTAGCPACEETVALVERLACPSCEVTVLNVTEPEVADRVRSLGLRSLPAVVIDGQLALCCTGRGADEASLRAAGIGQQL